MMTTHDMLTIAAVAFILICWAVEHPASFKWVGLVFGVAVVGAIVVSRSSSSATRYSETNERGHHRKECGHGHHRRRYSRRH